MSAAGRLRPSETVAVERLAADPVRMCIRHRWTPLAASPFVLDGVLIPGQDFGPLGPVPSWSISSITGLGGPELDSGYLFGFRVSRFPAYAGFLFLPCQTFWVLALGREASWRGAPRFRT